MRASRFYDSYLEVEQRIVAEHNAHRLFRDFCGLGRERILAVLLQLGCLSQRFVMWYEFAKQCLEDERAKEVVRVILRDEIPSAGPTHQDDRLADLVLLGVLKWSVLNTRPTQETERAMGRLWQLVNRPPPWWGVRDNHHDLITLVTLRIAGERLVGETYRHVTEAWTNVFGLDRAASRFYVPHFEHDRDCAEGGTHLAPFDDLLHEWIVSEEALQCAVSYASDAANARRLVYDQFVT